MPTTHHDVLTAAAQTAARAPSVLNTQPWSWTVAEDQLVLYADRDRQLTVADPDGRLLLLSCGAALHHAQLALSASGFQPEVERTVETFADTLLARIRIGGPSSPDPVLRAQFDAIPVRHTDRRPYADTPVATAEIEAMRSAAVAQGHDLHAVRVDQMPMLAVATAQAAAEENANPAFRDELRHWTNRPASAGDGIPPTNAVQHTARRVPIRDLATGFEPGLPVTPGGDRGAAYLVIHGRADTPADWLTAGEAVSAVILTATARGLATAPISDVIEVEHPRDLVAGLLPAGGRPYLVVRCGVPTDERRLPPAPRRDPSQMIREAHPG